MATHHLQTLNAEVGDFGERDPYTDVHEFHLYPPYEAEYVIRMKVKRGSRPEWSLTIGDCVHNLRSILDYAVLALWRAHSGEPAKIENVQFPIYSTQGGYREARTRRIGGVHPRVKTIIRLAQPYQRRNDPDGHPLMLLHALDNHDKHRVLHTTHAVVEHAPFEVLERREAVVKWWKGLESGPFEDDTPMLQVRLLALGRKPHFKVKFAPTYGIAFDKTGPGRGELVMHLLNDIRVYIRDDLLAALEPYF